MDINDLLGFLENVGKLPKELEPYVGQEVSVDAEGLSPFDGTLSKGPCSYIVSSSERTLQLYVGHPVTITTKDGKEFDFRKLK